MSKTLCPTCHGAKYFDTPGGIADCHTCEGDGTITRAHAADISAKNNLLAKGGIMLGALRVVEQFLQTAIPADCTGRDSCNCGGCKALRLTREAMGHGRELTPEEHQWIEAAWEAYKNSYPIIKVE
jgi:hypothetical protein